MPFGKRFEHEEMQVKTKCNKTWRFPLSTDLLRYSLLNYLNHEDKANLALAFTQADHIPEYHQAAVRKLLQHTAKGEAKEAEAMARLNYSLILSKGSFREDWCGQREWKAISPLQYAAWAGDTELVKLFIKYLPLEEQSEALQAALLQLKEVQLKGTEHGKHLSVVYRLADKCHEYEAKSESWTQEQRGNYWIQVIGQNQLNSVVNLLQWFCSRISFDPVPDFNQPLVRSLHIEHEGLLDLSPDSLLGQTHALYKGQEAGWYVPWLGNVLLTTEPYLFSDIEAIWAFCKTRTLDLATQISQLECALQLHKNQGVIKSPGR